jgi:hypothetical protein
MSTTSIYGDNLQGETETMRIEDHRGLVNTLGVLHHHIHDGHAFVASRDIGSIANGATADVLVICGTAKDTHFNYAIGSTGAFLIDIYEAPSYSAPGTAITIFNRNRTSANASINAVYHTPSGVSGGLQLPTNIIPGGNNVGSSVAYGDFDRFMFKRGLAYLLRLTNISGNNSRALIELSWYEPEENYS